jgi:Uma2 family endonuclease
MASARQGQAATDVPPFPVARFSVQQYHRMVECGAFTEHDGLELIDGWLVKKMAKEPAHEYAIGQVEELLRARAPEGWHVRNQAPITLARSEPEPDLTVVRGERGDYRDHHPGAADIGLAVEIADTTLATDRKKGRVYGAAGIAEYWIVNLPERCVEVYEDPSAEEEQGYRRCTVVREGAELAVTIDGHDHGTIAVATLLA